MSADGQLIAFETEANDLSSFPDLNSTQIFLYNRQTGALEFISTGRSPHLSPNGRYLVYENGNSGVTVYDVSTKIYQSYLGTFLGVGFASKPSVSNDGNFVAFSSVQNVYVFERQTQMVKLVATGSPGVICRRSTGKFRRTVRYFFL